MYRAAQAISNNMSLWCHNTDHEITTYLLQNVFPTGR